MSVILHIETATSVCSCALSENGQIIFNRQNREGLSHAVLLGVFVDEAIAFARTQQKKIEAIAVSSGPGSYTGLRIGVSEAKIELWIWYSFDSHTHAAHYGADDD
jgi:tRNA threonylcarbamoyladenosine biosynthesis protein TsaB